MQSNRENTRHRQCAVVACEESGGERRGESEREGRKERRELEDAKRNGSNDK